MSPSKKKVLRSSENVARKERSYTHHHDATRKNRLKVRNSSHHHQALNSSPKNHHRYQSHPSATPTPNYYHYYGHPHPYHYPPKTYQHSHHHNNALPRIPPPDEEKQLPQSLPSSVISLPSQATEKPPEPPRSAFMCFKDNKKLEIMKKEGITKDNDDLLKVFASAWKSLSEKEKAYWDEEARNDKVRFVREKAAYKGPWNLPKRRAKKDPNAPKRPMSAFLKFSKTRRKTVKEENPDVSNTDVSRLLGEIWRNATDAEKAPYVEAEIIERNKYKEVMKKWREEKAQSDAAIRTSHEAASHIFRENHHERQKATSQSSTFERYRDGVPTNCAQIERINVDPLMEEESPSKRSNFHSHVQNPYHRPQHPGQEYFLSDSYNQHSWPDLSFQNSIDHESDPLPVVPRMHHSLQMNKGVSEEYSGGYQPNRSFYFSDNSHHFPRYP